MENEKLPDWYKLLQRIYQSIMENPDRLSREDQEKIDSLLREKQIKKISEREEDIKDHPEKYSNMDEETRSMIIRALHQMAIVKGDELITVASIMNKAKPIVFKNSLYDIVRIKEGDTTDTHKAITALNPTGIMTYNYDTAHEAAWEKKGIKKINNDEDDGYDVILPDMKEKIRKLLMEGFRKPFILKAHGSTDDKKSLVLTNESYAELFTKYSYYKTLVQNILMNYPLLIVGFGMSDPDFDRMIMDLFTTFGGPIQTHIVITHEENKTPRDILYQYNYGFRYLYVKEYDDIPLILEDCIKAHDHTYVKELLDKLTFDKKAENSMSVRTKAHEELRGLNSVAKKTVAEYLEQEIKQRIQTSLEKPQEYAEKDAYILSEHVYSYGILMSENATLNADRKQFMIREVIEKCHDPKVVCHALYQIAPFLTKKDDLERVRKWRLQQFEKEDYFTDAYKDLKITYENNNKERLTVSRCVVYCKYLEALLQSIFL